LVGGFPGSVQAEDYAFWHSGAKEEGKDRLRKRRKLRERRREERKWAE
jgi:hypothetical protein